ncbi:279_t:CDS:2, partial [Dentiscutata erythropus]
MKTKDNKNIEEVEDYESENINQAEEDSALNSLYGAKAELALFNFESLPRSNRHSATSTPTSRWLAVVQPPNFEQTTLTECDQRPVHQLRSSSSDVVLGLVPHWHSATSTPTSRWLAYVPLLEKISDSVVNFWNVNEHYTQKKSVNDRNTPSISVEEKACPRPNTDYVTPLPRPRSSINDGYTSNCPILIESPEPDLRSRNNIFSENYYDDEIIIIDDVNLHFKAGNPAEDYYLEKINVSQMFRNYQNEA